MMKTYLDEASDALDGFEFLTMAEAGEVGHWEILGTLNERAAQERGLRARRLGAADPAAPPRDGAQGVARARVGGGSERDLVVGTPASSPPHSQRSRSRAAAAALARTSRGTDAAPLIALSKRIASEARCAQARDIRTLQRAHDRARQRPARAEQAAGDARSAASTQLASQTPVCVPRVAPVAVDAGRRRCTGRAARPRSRQARKHHGKHHGHDEGD